MSMRIWGPLLGLAILVAVTIWERGPAIERSLADRATARLAAAGVQNVGVQLNGRDATLTGAVDTAQEERELQDLISGVWGIRTVDSRLVRNDLAYAVTPSRRRPAPRGGAASTAPVTPPVQAPALETAEAVALANRVAELVDAKRIEFESSSDQLSRAGLATLDDVAPLLRDAPQLVVEIGGHTDNRGSERFNLDLSQRRAETVALALVERDIDKDRLVPLGFGSSVPRSSNRTEAGRQQNRRIEFRVVGETQR